MSLRESYTAALLRYLTESQPLQGGYLPYWLLLVSSAAFYNVAQSYAVQWQTKEIYGKKPDQGVYTNFDSRSLCAVSLC